MADEFPTLEVAQAVSVLWLGMRAFLFYRGALQLPADVEHIGQTLGVKRRLRRDRKAWLEPLARTAVALVQGDLTPLAARQLLGERAHRIARRLRQAAARDLIVSAVLIGALVYAGLSRLEVGPPFFALGALAALLAAAAVPARLSLARRLPDAAGQLATAALARREQRPASSARAPGCEACGQTSLVVLTTDAELGPRLLGLGVRELRVCPQCGHVSGAATPPQHPPT